MKLKRTVIGNEDFEIFFKNNKPKKHDFIFLDPPYDTEFSTYDNNPFVLEDQIRLRNFCKKTKANFMLIIKETDFILELYKDFNIKKLKKIIQ
ncbi:DNA adenine methylase [Streptobacillus notomytis]|uniref:DNA adenine methylase n=1 Tax=Streptobacillus notomytis TaxID=1712031 RepID=UPI000A74B825|nr:DNA adenine methylase [Streptobacillus notomytis]